MTLLLLAEQASERCQARITEARDGVTVAATSLSGLVASPLVTNGLAVSTKDVYDRLRGLDESLERLLVQCARHFEGRDDDG